MKTNENDNFLLYVPMRKHDNWERRNGRVVLIFYHDKPIEKFFRWLVGKSNITDMELDDMGSIVWENIDNKNNIYEIGQFLVKNYGEGCEPVYERLIMYLRYLNRKGWISFSK